MEYRIFVTDLVRKLGHMLGRVRYRGSSLGEALRAWRAAGDPDPSLADDLERIGAADRPPAPPSGS